MGIVVGVLSLLPRLSVSSSAPLNLDDPFSTPFTVSNDGPLSLFNVEFLCELNDVQTDRYVRFQGGKFFAITNTAFVAKKMLPAQKNDVPCSFRSVFAGFGPITTADISINIRFRPAFVPWHTNRRFRFYTVKGSDGRLRWLNRLAS